MEGMETLCCYNIEDSFGSHNLASSDLGENANEIWLVDFAYLGHSPSIQVHPVIRFSTEEPRTSPRQPAMVQGCGMGT